ncbi:trans-sialidase, partial [Trypanosoma rangeli]
EWGETHALNDGSVSIPDSLTQLSAGGGSGVVLSDGTLVFPMQATKTGGKTVLLAMRFTKSKRKWELSYSTMAADCRDPSIVEWDGQTLLMIASCGDGYYHVYESASGGKIWSQLGVPITRAWENSQNRQAGGAQSGVTTVEIEGRKVMLLTVPVLAEEGSGAAKGKGRLRLWLTDTVHTVDVGSVSREGDDAGAGSLLYGSKKKELILLYEKKTSGDSYSLVTVNLTAQLQRVHEVVRTWKDVDNTLKTCSASGQAKGLCAGPVPTKGLVGFLSAKSTGSEWGDEYFGVNATVTQGKRRVPNGVTFQGAGAGAVWPVAKAGQIQLYCFAKNRFTLAATVSIHASPGKDGSSIPLMGAKMMDANSTVLFGLSYTRAKKWEVTVNGKSRNLSADAGEWVDNATYHVALCMHDLNDWHVYVDGKKICSSNRVGHFMKRGAISHFYVGGDSAKGAEGSHHVTVANVLLYNRLLEEGEVQTLAARKVTIPPPEAEKPPIPQGTRVGGEGAAGAQPLPDVVTSKSTAGPRAKSSKADSSVRGCGAAVLLPLLLLGLWGGVSLV